MYNSTMVVKNVIVRNVSEAKAELSKLLVLVENGEEVIISRAGKPVAKLTLIEQQPSPRKFGALEGKWILPDDFDEQFKALDQEIADMFYGEDTSR